MSENEIARRKRAIKIAKAINSIEGVPVSEKAENIFAKWSEGKLTDEQMHSQMLAMYTKA
ncbi:MAG: antitoxin VbhA family protein [Ruminococcus sp.]|nr:antitoxin VbhA family protein [Ruminococcus sp.]